MFFDALGCGKVRQHISMSIKFFSIWVVTAEVFHEDYIFDLFVPVFLVTVRLEMDLVYFRYYDLLFPYQQPRQLLDTISIVAHNRFDSLFGYLYVIVLIIDNLINRITAYAHRH